MPDVADSEHAMPARLQREEAVAEIIAGEHEPTLVQLKARSASQSVFGSAPMNEKR